MTVSNEKVISQPITDPDQLVQWVETVRDRERRRARLLWAEWIENLAAFHGRNDIRVTDDLRMVQQLSPRDLKELEKINVNLVQPHVRTVAAKMQKGRPVLNGKPDTNDEQDVQAAKVADRLLLSEWKQQQMDLRRLEMAAWTACCGNGYFHTYFDRAAGPYNNGVPIGEIRTDVLSPFKVVVEPHRSSIERCRWAMIEEMFPIDQIEEQYGAEYQQRTGKPLKLKASDATDGKAVFNNQVTNTANSASIADLLLDMVGLPGRRNEQDSDFITTTTMYHLPTARYPQGIYAIIAGKDVLHLGPFPYDLSFLPIMHFRDVLCPWRFHGDSSATQVRMNQQNYVTLRNIELQYHLDNVHSKWLIPRGSGVDTDALTSRDNCVVEYVAGMNKPTPERVTGLSVPGSIYQSIELARDEANRSSGVNEASQGVAPAGVTAGRALISLQEQDDTRLAQSVQMAESEYSRWGKITLSMARQFYNEPRKYAAVGDTLAGAMFFFEKANLRGTWDVTCEPNSAMPMNKYAKQEAVLSLYQAGIFGDPANEETRTKARRMLEFGNANDQFDDDALDEQVSEKENLTMISLGTQVIQQITSELQQYADYLASMGQQPDPMMIQQAKNQALLQAVMPVESWDNHLVHLKCHLRRFKMPGVRDNPDMASIIRTHMDAHQMALNPQPGMMPPQTGQIPAGGFPTTPGAGMDQGAPGGQQATQNAIQTDQGQGNSTVATVTPNIEGTNQMPRNDGQLIPSDNP